MPRKCRIPPGRQAFVWMRCFRSGENAGAIREAGITTGLTPNVRDFAGPGGWVGRTPTTAPIENEHSQFAN